jgi:hypothetical protein
MEEKFGPKYNLLEKRFKRSRLDQNYNRWRKKFGPKYNLLEKGSSEAGWTKITTDGGKNLAKINYRTGIRTCTDLVVFSG